MFVSLAIIILSVILFAYWFRYSCLLILRTTAFSETVEQPVWSACLNLDQVQAALSDAAIPQNLDKLEQALAQDYRRINEWLAKSVELRESFGAVEYKMLKTNYSMMTTWYGMVRGLSPRHAREAVREMALIVNHFANTAASLGVVPSAA